MEERSARVWRWPTRTSEVPLGDYYVDSDNRLYLRGLNNYWAPLGMAEDWLGPSPAEKRYLRKSLNLKKGVRLS